MYKLFVIFFCLLSGTHLFAQVTPDTANAAHNKANLSKQGSTPQSISKALATSRAHFKESRLACAESLAHMAKARETGEISVFMQEAPIAIKALNKAVKAYNEGQNELKKITRIAEANGDCYKLLPLSKNTRNSANLAGSHLKEAAKKLAVSVKEAAYNDYLTAINAYLSQLDQMNVAARKLGDEIRRCLE